MSESCLGCKYLFTRDTGYSNYTVTDTDAHCVLKLNKNLPSNIPDEIREWTHLNPNKENKIERDEHGYVWVNPERDKWFATKDSKCKKYEYFSLLPYHIDCDGEDIMTIEDAEKHFFKTGDAMPLRISKYFGADYVDTPDWMKP